MAVLLRNASLTSFLFVCAGVLPAVVPDAAAQGLVVMASGLDNPHGLAFGPDGALYVVEAGRGGTTTMCLPNPTGPGQRCYGPTGAVTRIVGVGMQQRVLTGLPSVAVPGGAEAAGPHDIAFGFGRAFISVGSGGDPALLDPFRAAGIPLGWLLQASLQGVITPLVDVAAYESTANPDGGNPDSNLFALKVLSNRAVMIDAGGNSLLQVDTSLAVSTLATFPTRMVPGPGGMVPMESVPTSIAEGPDGSLYAGELTGFPFPVGGARVYRVPAAGGTPEVVAEGFTNIIDIAIGPDGAAYVLEHDANGLLDPGDTGRLIKIGPFGFRTELAAGMLVAPGKLAIGSDNSIYVTTNSASAGNGEVVRIMQ
ncbi:MAG TPA: ScyD/ScyE family protein [Vicinamibacterales bacterium]|nr:ScyD/ScyE family protein [Vicinamibacterales bacterium]